MSNTIILQSLLGGLALFMYVRALFYIIRVYRDIDKMNLVLLLLGGTLMCYNLVSTYLNSEELYFKWLMADIINAYVYYIVARNRKDNFFNLSYIIRSGLSKLDKRNLKRWRDDKPETITKEFLDSAEVGKVYSLDNKVQFEKVLDQDGTYHFVTTMKPGGSFGVHNHDCYETCIPFIGSLHCPMKEGKKVYRKNEAVEFAPGELHAPYADEFTVIRVYFH